MLDEQTTQAVQTTGVFAPQTNTVEINTLPPGAHVVGFGHRSGAETHQACPRRYFLNYEYLGCGIVQSPGPLYFAVGTAVHHGLANMLLGKSFDECLTAAHESLINSAAYQAIESVDTQTEQEVLVKGLLYAFYIYAYPGLARDFEVLCVETGAVEYVPVEGCSYVACGWYETGSGDDLSDKFQEGGRYCHLNANHEGLHECSIAPDTQGRFDRKTQQYVAIQSRPDAILRNRKTHEVVGISWKTIDDPSDLRRSQLVNDLQGFMELHYGEKILEKLAGAPVTAAELDAVLSNAWKAYQNSNQSILEYIHGLRENLETLEERAKAARDIPTDIDYIQTIFLVKGPRKLIDPDEGVAIPSNWNGSDSSDEYGGYQPGKQYRQMSHLCYRYRNGNPVDRNAPVEVYKSGPNKGKPKVTDDVNDPNYQDESWAYRFFKPNNETGSALSPKWLTSQIQPDQVCEWVERLNRGEVYPSTMNDERNSHPLAKVIRFEEPLYKDATRAASHVRQQHNRFIQIARNMQEFNEWTDNIGTSAHEAVLYDCLAKLDDLFPQQLISCRTPYRCAYHTLCHTPAESQIDFMTIPEGFELRTPHHEFEREFRVTE